MITALIFDCDGLNIDTATPTFASWQMIYAEYGRELALSLWQHTAGCNCSFDAGAHLI